MQDTPETAPSLASQPAPRLADAQKYVVRTLGCKANLYDSQLIEAELQKRGWRPALDPNSPDVGLYIVNSCTVTDEADRQSRKMAARLGRDNPDARVVITGCSAEVDPERLASSRGIDYVIGNRDKPKLVEIVLEKIKKAAELKAAEGAAGTTGATDALTGVRRGEVLGVAQGYREMTSRHPIDREWPATESAFSGSLDESSSSHRTRAFLKIQDGCNAFCTYCVIPYGRGPSRSISIPDVISQVKNLASQGVREVVITGINIGDYGTDWSEGMQVEQLFETILGETELPRLRVSSLDPSEITPGLMKLVEKDSRFCPHFHVSLQSPHPRILRLMKRKYSEKEVRECLTKISELAAPAGGVFVGMDLITGFPGETDEEFEWTVKALEGLPWSRLHVFPYSERSGTPATRLPGSVPPQVRAARAEKLRALSLERLKSVYRKAWATLQESGRPLTSVLMEGSVRGPDGSRDWVSGYSLNYLRVMVKAPGASTSAGSGLENQILEDLVPYEIIVDSDGGDVAFLARRS